MTRTNYIEKSRPHESAKKHITGLATYIDDMVEPDGLLYAAIGYSSKAHAIIKKKIDFKEVLKSEGVVAVVTHLDIPENGRNDAGTVYPGDPILASKKVEYSGQIIFAVAAKTTELARKAVLKAKISYKTLKPIVTIRDALKKKSFVLKGQTVSRGKPLRKIDGKLNYLKGEMLTPNQEHCALEGQISIAIPQEDGKFLIHSSTQNPSETQHVVAKMLNQKNHTIQVSCRRLGGGFGGKEVQSIIFAAIATLLAKKTKRPVKLRLPRETEFIVTGKRHDFWSEYQVYYDDLGIIDTLKVKLASRCGFSPDLSGAVNLRALMHIDACYYTPNLLVENYLCKTNTASNTALRGFGASHAALIMENIIDNISRKLAKDSTVIRRRNFYLKDKKNTTHYGQKIHDNVTTEIFDKLLKDSNYQAKKREIEKFNSENKVLKKAHCLLPIRFGISFAGAIHLNQAGALVHIYTDGSVLVTSGGVEMGQGFFTKLQQLVANELGINYDKVLVSTTRTDKVPNASASASSQTFDLNGSAALNAVKKIKQNLLSYVKSKYKIKGDKAIYENGKVKFKGKTFSFPSLIRESYANRINLSANGFYKSPKIHFDKKKFKGRPFLYFCYGVCHSTIILDTLTGENRVLEVQILHDAGRRINNNIEYGQCIGGFLQGMGNLTTEEMKWKSNGEMWTKNFSTYKPPLLSDMPEKFNLKFFEHENQEQVVAKSRTTGEPPLLLSNSVFLAIKQAVHSVNGYDPKRIPDLRAPATPEAILMSIKNLKSKL